MSIVLLDSGLGHHAQMSIYMARRLELSSACETHARTRNSAGACVYFGTTIGQSTDLGTTTTLLFFLFGGSQATATPCFAKRCQRELTVLVASKKRFYLWPWTSSQWLVLCCKLQGTRAIACLWCFFEPDVAVVGLTTMRKLRIGAYAGP